MPSLASAQCRERLAWPNLCKRLTTSRIGKANDAVMAQRTRFCNRYAHCCEGGTCCNAARARCRVTIFGANGDA
jgi:hypothetical protein